MSSNLKILTLAILFLLTAIGPSLAEPTADTIQKGKEVTIDYTLEVDGKVVQSSVETNTPLTYTQGDNQIIPGLQKQLEGLKVGDQRKVTLQAPEAFGVSDPTALIEIPKSKLPAGNPQVGMVLNATGTGGQNLQGMIKEIKQDSIVVDFNHPLAGKTVTFDVTVKTIK